MSCNIATSHAQNWLLNALHTNIAKWGFLVENKLVVHLHWPIVKILKFCEHYDENIFSVQTWQHFKRTETMRFLIRSMHIQSTNVRGVIMTLYGWENDIVYVRGDLIPSIFILWKDIIFQADVQDLRLHPTVYK